MPVRVTFLDSRRELGVLVGSVVPVVASSGSTLTRVPPETLRVSDAPRCGSITRSTQAQLLSIDARAVALLGFGPEETDAQVYAAKALARHR